MSKSLFTKEEIKVLVEFVQDYYSRGCVNFYDYLSEKEEHERKALVSVSDKLRSLLDIPTEKCW